MKVIPPVVALLYLSAGYAVHKLLPSEPIIPHNAATTAVGIAVAGAGVALAVWAAIQFSRADTTKDPFGTPTALVTTGPFRYTRNPMYVGVTLLLLAGGIIVGSAALLAPPVAFVYTLSRGYIPREEKVLRELFGAEFEKYAEAVRRWI